MGIEIVPYTDEFTEQVIEFNRRMHDGGTTWGWYEHSEDEWLPRRAEVAVWREHFLALEDHAVVRGAYALKPQDWRIGGRRVVVTDWQGPVSEGLLSRRYATLGLRMIRDMLKRYPLLYSWGHGGEEAKMLQLLRSLKWHFHATPFLLKVCKPFRFLRENAYLRGTPARRVLLDALAFSGLGWLGLKLLFAALSLRGGGARADCEVVEEFGPWADELWERCCDEYEAIGLRDAKTMNALLPPHGWPEAIRLRVTRDGATLGWAAVMDHQLRDDDRFGNLRVGSVIDCLARVEDAPAVIAAATRFLVGRGVDLIVANQSHPAWVRAFEASGFLALRGRRYFAMSPDLHEALSPFDRVAQGLHLTNLDGHGPHGL